MLAQISWIFLEWPLSQAAACDGQTCDITYGSAHNETYGGYLNLLHDRNHNDNN